MNPDTADVIKESDPAAGFLSSFDEITRIVIHYLKPLLKRESITWEQFLTLHVISRTGPVSTSTLAQHLAVSLPTVSSSINHLEKAGLVTRERSERDRRTVTIRISLKGERVVEYVWKHMKGIMVEGTSDISYEEISTTLQVLHKIKNNLESRYS